MCYDAALEYAYFMCDTDLTDTKRDNFHRNPLRTDDPAEK